MTLIDACAPHRRTTFRIWLLLLLALAMLVPAGSLQAEDRPKNKPDENVGKINVKVKAKDPTPPDDPQAAERIAKLAPSLLGAERDWHKNYVAEPAGGLSDAAQATLAVALAKEYGRTQALHDLKHGGERVRPLIRNLDVGRHELLKHIYNQAMILANEKLKADGLTPLNRVQAVNAGGTGDYTRDQDITVFADDPVREKAFFDAVEVIGKNLKLKVDVKSTGGIDFPEIEVTFFKGGNDLPDARFATDVEEFALKYQKAIANQAADKEAYKGGGAKIEVEGRRIPGQMYVQQFTWEGGKPVYVAETPKTWREGASLFSKTAPERWHDFQRSAHIFSDFLQGRQHSGGEHADPTKGPLKYAGRAVDHLCALHGMEPWVKLKPVDRFALLQKVWPTIDPKTEGGAKMMQSISEALDTAADVKTFKELPKKVDATQAAKHDKIALSFLRNATSMTVSKMAQDMLNPPAFDTRAMRALAGASWDRMSPIERFNYARQKDELFRAATGRASMENLLVAVSLLRTMDFEDGKSARHQPGKNALATMQKHADAQLKPILALAADYAEAWARRQQTADPHIRAECDKTISTVRNRLVAVCPLVGAQMPGEVLLRNAAKDGPRAVMEAETQRGRSWLPQAALEAHTAFQDHLKQAFPSHMEEWRQFRSTLSERGVKSYIAQRMFDEFVQWDTVADALTLVEMYQNGAGWRDCGYFLGVNLVSRIHWGVGPMIQAYQIKDAPQGEAEKQFKELGKSLVFMTLCRVVPWAASVKIGFDIMRGTVVVTVGWAVGKANQATIDAVYTGEAGRTDMTAAGTKRGSLRDSGSRILEPQHVKRLKDHKTGELVIAVDRNALYQHFFRQWTGSDASEVPRSRLPRGDAARFVQAHDAFVKVLWQQAEQFGPTWVQSPDKPFVPLRLTEKEVEVAVRALEPFLRSHAEKEADRVLAEVAVRSYRSYLDAEGVDVIREGLVNRFSSDLLGGLIEHWHVRITAQILAARNLERTAAFLDMAAIAASLHEKYVPSAERMQPLEMKIVGGRWRAVKKGLGETAFVPTDPAAQGDPGVSFKLDAQVDGVPVRNGLAVDGSQPVRVSAVLHGTGQLSDVERNVKIEIKTEKLKKLRKVGEEDEDGPVGPGDVAEDLITVRAVAADGTGPELARVEIPLRILIPEAEDMRSVVLWRREERDNDGRLRERYTFVKPFEGMPDEWVTEYGLVFHGDYERYHGDGATISEIRRFRFGVLHGKVESFDEQGRLLHETPYENGKVHGEDIRYELDGLGKFIIRYEHEWAAEEHATGSKGQPIARITYNPADGDPSEPYASGEAIRWWSNGQIRWRGRFERTWPKLGRLGGSDGEQIGGKTATWEWFFTDGSLALRAAYAEDKRTGPYDGWDFVIAGSGASVSQDRSIEKGDMRVAGTYDADVRVGAWRRFDWKGRPLGTEEYVEGKAVSGENITWHENGNRAYRGRWTTAGEEGASEYYYESGNLQRVVTWHGGRMEGKYESRHEQGQMHETGSYQGDEKHGLWETYSAKGTLLAKQSYKEGKAHGPWEAHAEDGTLGYRGAFKDGARDGPWTERLGDQIDWMRRLYEQGDYVKGEREGVWKSYDSDTAVPVTYTYVKGQVVKRERRD